MFLGIGAYALFMGIISGYPIGAKIVTNFRNNNLCSKAEAERLITFTNNSGPLFILGTVGITLFYDSHIGILLLFTHILASLTVGILFRFWKYKDNLNRSYEFTDTINFSSLGSIISQSILSSINSIFMIGGFIILFGIFLSILSHSYILNFFSYLLIPIFKFFNIKVDFIIPIITGVIELTSGVVSVSSITSKNIGINIVICSFLLGFGGLSIILQVLSIISKSDISIKPYILGKLLQGTIAAVYTYFIITILPIFNYLRI